MASIIQIKRSTTPGAVPADNTLAHGELAVNIPDKKLFTANSSGNTFALSGDRYNLTAIDGTVADANADAATIQLITDNTTLANDWVSFVSGEAIDIGATISASGSDTVPQTATITIAAEIATSSNKGVAQFHTDDFVVTGGEVTLADTNAGAVLVIQGTANEVDVSRANGTVTVGLPDDVTITSDLTVTSNTYIGGGYGSTGTTLASDGNISTNGILTVDGNSALNGGITVDGANFVVDGATGSITTASSLNVSLLSSLDGGIDVNGANFTVATSGAVDTASTLTVDGLASLDGGIDVDGVMTVADTTGAIATSGTLSVTNATGSTSSSTGAATITGGVGVGENLYVGGVAVVEDTTQSTSTSTGSLIVGGGAGIAGNLYVGGNLDIAGTQTVVDSTTVSIGDSLLKLAADNSSDTNDIGWYGVYNDGATKYAGIFRDASATPVDEGEDVFVVWSGLTAEPGTTVNFATGGLAQLDAIIDGGTY